MSFKPWQANETVMLLIDHQIGTMGWVKSATFEEMKQNALMLAKTARIFDIPTLLTSSMEEYAQGALLPELAEILPDAFAARVKRQGVVNAMDDEEFAKWVQQHTHQRHKIIIAGVTNDVCTVYPVLTLLGMGYEVQVVADAGGSPSKISDELALMRMRQAGATITSTNQLIAELVGNWSTAEGQKVLTEVIAPTLA